MIRFLPRPSWLAALGAFLVGAFAFYLAVVSALGHKEARFLVSLLPLFVAIAARPAS